MSIATIISGFGGKRAISSRMRLVLHLRHGRDSSTGLALAGHHSFLKEFSAFLLFLLAFFTPWSAINLVDYYCHHQGTLRRARHCSIPTAAMAAGTCTGIAVYVFGVLVQMPFLSTGFYTGPLAARLDGADISWIVGLIAPGLVYYVVTRKARAAQRERANVVEVALSEAEGS